VAEVSLPEAETPAFKLQISQPSGTKYCWCGSAHMMDDGETVRIMMHIGAVLRLSTRDLVNEPMMRQIMLQLRAQPERDGLATLSLVPYEPLPDELRRLLKQFNRADSKDDDAV
jgi:hypothetical protein